MSESQKCKAFDLCALWQQTWWCDTLGNRHVGNGGWHGGVRIEDDVRVLHGACDEATQQAVSSHGHMNKRPGFVVQAGPVSSKPSGSNTHSSTLLREELWDI